MTIVRNRIAVVYGKTMFAESLVERVNAEPDLTAECISLPYPRSIDKIRAFAPHVVVIDINSPTESLFEFAVEAAGVPSRPRLLVVSDSVSEVVLTQAVRVNISGYVLTEETLQTLLNAFRRIAEGDEYFSKPVRDLMQYDAESNRYYVACRSGLAALTSRQIDVLRFLAIGRSVKEVARRMCLSEKAVDSHKYRIMHKLGIHDRVELSRYSIREGLILP